MNRVEQALLAISKGELAADAIARFPETLTDNELAGCFSALVASLGDEPHLQDFSWGILHAVESLDRSDYARRLYSAYNSGHRPRGSWRHLLPYRALRNAAYAASLAQLASADDATLEASGFMEVVRELAAGEMGPQGATVAKAFLMEVANCRGQSSSSKY